ncbi:MAG: peptidase family C69 [Alphaproteobacteria bacterium]|nr:peptidase family C69 [Alphaproteobacteria bacterium]
MLIQLREDGKEAGMCDTVVVVGANEAGDPRILFAKNSDRDATEPQLLEWVPARDWPAGTTVRCSQLAIPQVAHTHAVLLSRPYWMWGAEMGVNEHGVVIGNEAVFTRDAVPEVGLSGMDLLRLALQRSASAAEAIAVLEGLLDAWPQGGAMGHEDRGFRYYSSFIVADGREAYVFETVGSERAVERVVSGARAISNGLTLPALVSHTKALHTTVAEAGHRRARMESVAAGATGAGDLFRALRDHGAHDAPCYRWHNGALSAPCVHPGGLLAASQTTASLVVELGAGEPRIWATATSAPCTSIFKPVRVDTPLDLGAPGATPNDSLWWRHERLHRLVMRDHAARLARYAAERDATEARWLADPPAPAEAFAEADALLARWTADQPADGPDDRPWYVRRFWARRA